MRESDSPELCRRLFAEMPGLNVLMVGVNATPEHVASVIKSSAAGVVAHTIDEDDLVEASCRRAHGDLRQAR